MVAGAELSYSKPLYRRLQSAMNCLIRLWVVVDGPRFISTDARIELMRPTTISSSWQHPSGRRHCDVRAAASYAWAVALSGLANTVLWLMPEGFTVSTFNDQIARRQTRTIEDAGALKSD